MVELRPMCQRELVSMEKRLDVARKHQVPVPQGIIMAAGILSIHFPSGRLEDHNRPSQAQLNARRFSCHRQSYPRRCSKPDLCPICGEVSHVKLAASAQGCGSDGSVKDFSQMLNI